MSCDLKIHVHALRPETLNELPLRRERVLDMDHRNRVVAYERRHDCGEKRCVGGRRWYGVAGNGLHEGFQ